MHLPGHSLHRKGSFKREYRVLRKKEDKAETPVSFQDSSLFVYGSKTKQRELTAELGVFYSVWLEMELGAITHHR